MKKSILVVTLVFALSTGLSGLAFAQGMQPVEPSPRGIEQPGGPGALPPGYSPAAPSPDVTPIPIEVQRYGDIPYFSGGVGVEERQWLQREAEAEDYNLKLVFATRGEPYLAQANVVVNDQQGNTVLDAFSEGSWFYAKLPPGTYDVTASIQGNPITRRVVIGSGEREQVTFRWNWRPSPTGAPGE